MKKINIVFYSALFLIIVFTQFFHPVNGLADDQMGLLTAEKVIENITPQEGYKTLMEKYIEVGGLHPCSAMGLPWINPIYTLVTHSYSSIVGLSIPKWHFFSVILFVGLLCLAKKLGDFFFGRYGFIFPLLLATNLYILVSVRNSIHLFLLGLLLQLGAIYYFLRGHQGFDLKNVSISALFLFLALGNGYTYIPIVYLYLLIILFSLFFWKTFKGKGSEAISFWKKEYYLFLFLGVPLFAVMAYFVNDLILNVPLGSSLDGALYFFKSKFPPSEFPTFGEKITQSIYKFKEVFLGTSFREIFGPHYTFFPYQTPVLDKVAAFLFFLGILSFFNNFTYQKLIFLGFLAYTFYFIHSTGAARIFIVFVPFLLLVASSGFVFLLEIFKKLKFNRLISGFFLLLLFCFLVHNVYFFENYFVVQSNANLIKGAGMAEVKKYLDSIEKTKVLVLLENDYPVWYLADFRTTDFVKNPPSHPEEFREKIKKLQDDYGEVIVIFPTNFSYVGNPGLLTAVWEDFNYRYRFFFEAFPEKTLADKVVSNYQEIPQHFLYRFSKDEPLPQSKQFVFEDFSQGQPFGFNGEILALRIQGGVKNLRFGDEEIEVRTSPSAEAVINFGQESYYNFYLNYGNESFKENLYQKEKLKIEERFLVREDGGLTWIEANISPDTPPYTLEYLFELPYQIKRVDVKNDMRLFNAEGSHTVIKGYLVDKEKNFSDYLEKGRRFSFFEVKSDNSNTYAPGGEVDIFSRPHWGIGRLSSYAVLKPQKIQKVLISFLFETKYYRPGYFLAHLYNLGYSSFVKFTLDTEALVRPKVNEKTIFSLEKDEIEEGPVAVQIIYH